MNTVILYIMGIASIVVLIAGAGLCVTLLVYIILRFWEKFSNVAHNVVQYLRQKNDFERYMDDFAAWENVKRSNADKCRFCEYRKQVLEQDGERHE